MRLPDKNNFQLLVVALVLATITYVYLNQSMRKTIRRHDSSYQLLKLTAKTVPVKVRFASSPPEGYVLNAERVSVNPKEVTLIGPEALLESTVSAETAIMDISQTTRRVTKVIPLESVAGIHLDGKKYLVEVTVPIEKLSAEN